MFFGVAELIVRIASPDLTLPAPKERFRFDQTNAADRPSHVRDERLGWRLAPGQSESMTTNARGFRGPAFDVDKAVGTYRILFAGDSNPLGFGITDDDAPYPFRVGHLLQRFYSEAAGVRFEVIDLAVDGYSSHQVALLLDEWIPKLHPDLICVQVGFNDYCVAAVSDAEAHFGRPWVLDMLERSHAYRWLRRKLLSATRRDTALENPVPRVSPERYAENVAGIVETAAHAGAPVLLVTTPVRPSVPLVVNEVPVSENGASEWMTQDAWIRRKLAAAGVSADAISDDAYVRVVERAMTTHPEWPILPFLRARAADARGERTLAAVYEQKWRELDGERAVLTRYFDVLGEIAARRPDVRVVDAGRALEAYARETSGVSAADLFIDFVHLNPIGHVVVATEVTRVIVEQILRLGSG